jgi:hypothetical protein
VLERNEDDRQVWCLGCGAAIGPGHLKVRFEEYWVLCADCADDEPMLITVGSREIGRREGRR